jgi:hypothetical protein
MFLWQDFGNGRNAREMIVHAGQQHRARRRAERRGVVMREQRPAARERVDVRRARLAAIDAEVHEGRVVDEQDNEVRTRRNRIALGQGRRTQQGKPTKQRRCKPNHGALPDKHAAASFPDMRPGPQFSCVSYRMGRIAARIKRRDFLMRVARSGVGQAKLMPLRKFHRNPQAAQI